MGEPRSRADRYAPHAGALFTDLYELTMAGAYDAERMNATAVFELFFRELPDCRNYVVAAGLDDVLAYIEGWRFTEDDLAYLGAGGDLPPAVIDRLRGMRFSGDIFAMPEGTIVFPGEPLVQVIAPVIEAQLVETYLLNQIHLQSVIATKAARVVGAAAGRSIVDFGSRRAHGIDAAVKVARASYLAGAAGTSNVLAGRLYGIPVFGTMAHSFVQAHHDELSAFEAFARVYPTTTLLVDTMNATEGVRNVIALSRRFRERFRVGAIRLDSGDLGELARRCRVLLDEAGLARVRIIASSGLDEYAIADLVTRGAPIDGFGVGTKLAVSADAPTLDMAYKLVEYDGVGRLKLSPGKVVYPGRKQVFRFTEGGRLAHDLIGRYDEASLGTPLLKCVMRGGERIDGGLVSLESARQHASSQVALLPDSLRSLAHAVPPYRVDVSDALECDLERAAGPGGG